jgi:hypothetical protein
MKVARAIRYLTFTAVFATLPACSGPTEQERVAEDFRQDSLSVLRSELADQAMQASMFVNEVNKALAMARSLSQNQAQLLTTAELADVNAERNAVLARVTQLVEQLDAARGRIYGLRKQVADKDSTLAQQMAQFEQSLAEANAAAESQRAQLQAVIDGQSTQIASLSAQADTLSGKVTQLTTEQNAVYVVAGTRDELIKKGVLVSEGPRRFVVAGKRPLVPARELDASVFTKIDRRTDTTIVLPDGVYKIVSRQNGSVATPLQWKQGGIAGALTIEDPERFWSTSRFLILVKS